MTPEQQAAQDAANAASSQVAQQFAPNEPQPEAPQPEPAPVEPAPAPVEGQQAPEVIPEAPVTPQEPVPAAPAPEPEDDYAYDPIPTFNIPAPQVQPQYQAPQFPQAPQVQAPQTVAPLNPADFTDQFGNVDNAKFAQAVSQRDALLTQNIVQSVMREVQSTILPQAEARSAQQLMAVRSEERQWKAAETAYPELATNKELRDLVHNTRLNYTAQGAKQLSPKAAADKLFKYIGQARDEATNAAQETVRYQAANTHVETANNTQSEKSVQREEVRSRIASKDRSEARDARHSLLKQMMEDGSLKLPS